MRSWSAAAAIVILACIPAAPAAAGTIVDDWASVTVPPQPELKSVTPDPKTTAPLVPDFNGREDAASGPCNAAVKPRCLASIPKVLPLVDAARACGVFVAYSTSASGTAADIRAGVAPMPGEPVVRSGPDKFIGTAPRDLLARRGIETAVVTGTAAEGAVLAHAPGVSQKTMLTRIDAIGL